MRLNWRAVAAIVVLAISLTLLVWGFWPAQRRIQVLPIEPSNLSLPTATSLISPSFNIFTDEPFHA